MAGRAKAKKTSARERDGLRREAERTILAALSSFGDPLPVAHAIVSSPMGVHRYLTLAPAVRLAIRAAAQRRPAVAACGGMGELVHLLVARAEGLSLLEDAIPIDPRVPVVGVFRGRLYRLYPGMLERPLAALRTAELVSEAVDPVLQPDTGFGVADYVEVCLGHSERAVRVLGPVWSEGPLPVVGDLPVVTAAEVAAAQDVVMWSPLGPETTAGQRKALAWATVSLGQLKVDLEQGMAGTCFGSALAVAGPGGSRFALPLPYVAEAWQRTVAVLAVQAAARSLRCGREWLRIVRAEVGQLLASLRDLPPAWIAHGPAGPVAIVRFGHRHLLVLAVAADIGACDIGPAERAVAAITPGVTVRTDAGPVTLADDAEIVRVVVAAPVGSAMLGVPAQVALVTLEDLQWMVTNCDRADELWAFFHEDVVTNQDVRMFGWETSNTWQFWRDNGQALHRAGLAPTGILVSPHQVGDRECAESADRAPFEWALARVGLPPSRDLRTVQQGRGPIKLLTHDYTLWALALLQPDNPSAGAVLAEVQEGYTPEDVLEFATNLIGTAGFVALHHRDAASAAFRECGLDHLVVSFEYDSDSAEPLSGEASGRGIRLRWNAHLQQMEAEQPGFIQNTLGALLTRVLARQSGAGEAVRAFAALWHQTPRMIVVSAYEAPLQHARGLTRPQPVPEWAVSQANRRLGRYLWEAGHDAGRRDRAASRRLELEVIVPWLRREVDNQFSQFNRVAVLRRAACEIEAVTSARNTERRHRLNRVHMPTGRLTADNVDPTSDEDVTLAHHSAILATLLELALAADYGGQATPDDVEWSHLLALAGLFRDSTIRCDALLHEMSSEVTTISDRFEITVEPVDAAAIDVDAFNSARLRHAHRDAEQPDRNISGPSPDEIFAVVDPAMTADLGCTARTLMGACAVISSWPVTDHAAVADVELDELCEQIVSELGVESGQAKAAVNALTLTRDGLRAERVQPWKGRSRDHRLLARPIIQLDEQTALLLPWNTESTGKVFSGYLSQGLVPWPTSRLDNCPTLGPALNLVRSARTTVLEDQVDAELKRLGFTIRTRIKQHHASTIGLPNLPGEIDHIAIRSEDGVLWVVEDKDLTDVFTPAEIARGVRQFFDNRKGEIPKLLAKVMVVEENIEAVANTLGVPVPTAARGLFVTRNPIPAAFAPSAPVTFTTLRELDRTVETYET